MVAWLLAHYDLACMGATALGTALGTLAARLFR